MQLIRGKNLLGLIGLLALVNLRAVSAQVPTSSIQYLKSQPADAWVVMALSAAFQEADLSRLKSAPLKSATDYEKQILALIAAGQDPRQWQDKNLVAEFLEKFYQSNQIGEPNLLNDDFWGVITLSAIKKSGISSQTINQAIEDSKQFILKNQKANGWGYSVSGLPDSNDTAVAVIALVEAGVDKNDPAIQQASNFLKELQNNDGGVSFSQGLPSDAASDAWVISALDKLGIDPKSWQKNDLNLIDHLMSLKNADGSFRWQEDQAGNSTVTGYAVIALSGKSYPVLNAFSASEPPSPADIESPANPPGTSEPSVDQPISPEPVSNQPADNPVTNTPGAQPTPTPAPASVPPANSPAFAPLFHVFNFDSDNDKLTDQAEDSYHTDPKNPDSDGDGFPDGVEVAHSYDPLNPAPCKKIFRVQGLFAYGKNRLINPESERCFAGFLLNQLKGAKVTWPWFDLVNAFIYGNYSVQDIRAWIAGKNTVHPFNPKF